MIKFCEFIGNKNKDFDEVPKSERLCKYAGFSHCTLHNQLLGDYEGWRVCCSDCLTPKYVKN